MPCRDYEDDRRYDEYDARVQSLKKQNDRLARIACRAMTALEQDGRADLLLLADEEVRSWWEQHKIADAKARAEAEEKPGVLLFGKKHWPSSAQKNVRY